MDEPLGRAVGNALEIEEAILTLKGEGPPDLEELCLELGGHMLALAGRVAEPAAGKATLKRLLEDGSALKKLKELIVAQHGDPRVVDQLSLLPAADHKIPVPSPKGGYVLRIRAEAIGRGAMLLGAGRETKESPIDLGVGIVLQKKVGDPVRGGEALALLHTRGSRDQASVSEALTMIEGAYEISPTPVERPKLILGSVGF
jgi:pyrimidine-nucleoside phosphorylase